MIDPGSDFTPMQLRNIRQRWEEFWKPQMFAQNFRYGDVNEDRVKRYRHIHFQRMIALRRAGIGGNAADWWLPIRRHQLDNPFWSDTRFRQELREALERRTRTLGWSRRKGSKRGVESVVKGISDEVHS